MGSNPTGPASFYPSFAEGRRTVVALVILPVAMEALRKAVGKRRRGVSNGVARPPERVQLCLYEKLLKKAEKGGSRTTAIGTTSL